MYPFFSEDRLTDREIIKKYLTPFKEAFNKSVNRNLSIKPPKRITVAILLGFLSLLFFRLPIIYFFWHELGHAVASIMTLSGVSEFYADELGGLVRHSNSIFPWFIAGAGAGFGLVFPFIFWYIFNKIGLDFIAPIFLGTVNLLDYWGDGSDFIKVGQYESLALISYILLALLFLALTIKTYVRRDINGRTRRKRNIRQPRER